ncbi:MAG: TRAP transporter large permease subunit [Betaproteobacteria bacterium]|nr:TRAP transporter large permease subunit [Betaproteobacteria bacterium]
MSSKDEDLIHDIAAAHHIAVDEAALKKAEQYIEAEEGAINRLTGLLGRFVVVVAVVMSFFHLYAAYAIVPTQQLRMVHVGFVLFLSYLLFPFSRGYRHRVMWWDWIGAAVSLVVIGYGIFGGDDFTDRSTIPTNLDMVFGVILTLLVLEAARRGTGWIMPFVCVLFVAYAMLGPYLGEPWTHRGYDISRLVGHMYMTLEGIFGVPVDVSSSLIILFTIYGAFLQMSGAGKFFIDFSFAAMGGKSTGAGRTIVLSSFLLGGPSGSGVDDTDAVILLRAAPDGRDRRAQVRHAQRRHRQGGDDVGADQTLRVPLPVAGRDHCLHAARLLAGGGRVLGDRGRVCHERAAPRLRAHELAADGPVLHRRGRSVPDLLGGQWPIPSRRADLGSPGWCACPRRRCHHPARVAPLAGEAREGARIRLGQRP